MSVLHLATEWTDGTFLSDPTFDEGKHDAPRQMVEFLCPSQVTAYEPPAGHCLIGDSHVQLGAPFVIAGAPGVGKSRAATKLAICGATGRDFFSMEVHRKFRTMILQCENGPVRLKSEYLPLPEKGYSMTLFVCRRRRRLDLPSRTRIFSSNSVGR